MAIEGNTLIVHTIYKDPSDFPGLYVGRAFRIAAAALAREGALDPVPDPRPFAVAPTLAEIRAALPAGSDYRMPRQPDDDPCIVESWL